MTEKEWTWLERLIKERKEEPHDGLVCLKCGGRVDIMLAFWTTVSKEGEIYPLTLRGITEEAHEVVLSCFACGDEPDFVFKGWNTVAFAPVTTTAEEAYRQAVVDADAAWEAFQQASTAAKKATDDAWEAYQLARRIRDDKKP